MSKKFFDRKNSFPNKFLVWKKMLVPKIIWPKKFWASKRFWVWKKFQVWKIFGTKGTRGCACAHAFSLFFIIAGELSVCWSLSYYGVFLISLLFSHNKKLLAISVILPKLLGTNRLSNKEKLYKTKEFPGLVTVLWCCSSSDYYVC